LFAVSGIDELKSHPYFAGIDWAKLGALKIDPPFVPAVRAVLLLPSFRARRAHLSCFAGFRCLLISQSDVVNAKALDEVGEFRRSKFHKVRSNELASLLHPLNVHDRSAGQSDGTRREVLREFRLLLARR
jgi:hypothetical protein